MSSTTPKIMIQGCRSSVLLAIAVLGGCLQTVPVVERQHEYTVRQIYYCPYGKTLDVTRERGKSLVLVWVDDYALQMHRAASRGSGESYSNGYQTLTLFGNSAVYESTGQGTGQLRYGPCKAGPPIAPRQ